MKKEDIYESKQLREVIWDYCKLTNPTKKSKRTRSISLEPTDNSNSTIILIKSEPNQKESIPKRPGIDKLVNEYEEERKRREKEKKDMLSPLPILNNDPLQLNLGLLHSTHQSTSVISSARAPLINNSSLVSMSTFAQSNSMQSLHHFPQQQQQQHGQQQHHLLQSSPLIQRKKISRFPSRISEENLSRVFDDFDDIGDGDESLNECSSSGCPNSISSINSNGRITPIPLMNVAGSNGSGVGGGLSVLLSARGRSTGNSLQRDLSAEEIASSTTLELREEIERLKEQLREMEALREENRRLKLKVVQLKAEKKDPLKLRIDRIPSPFVPDEASLDSSSGGTHD